LGANVVFSLKLDVKHRFIPEGYLKFFQIRTKPDACAEQYFSINTKKATARMDRAAAGIIASSNGSQVFISG
jgi:hypothetical protein